ncbi:MAG: DUF2164 domain-containing protein [Candidatus Tenebribacter burtonii]|jgi:uncharacterized protein (DUF2164 family)|nr:DUF2164 domain-containing protein [Candidatus Tenebribacter burtonii]
MSKKNKFKINKDKRKLMQEKIKRFFVKERDEEIGDLSAILILDFIIDNLASEFYNLGVRDCITHISQNVEDLFGLEK